MKVWRFDPIPQLLIRKIITSFYVMCTGTSNFSFSTGRLMWFTFTVLSTKQKIFVKAISYYNLFYLWDDFVPSIFLID